MKPIFSIRPVLWEPLCELRHYLGSDLETDLKEWSEPCRWPATLKPPYQIDLRPDGRVEVFSESNMKLLHGTGSLIVRGQCHKCKQLNELHSDEPDYEPRRIDYAWELEFVDGYFGVARPLDE